MLVYENKNEGKYVKPEYLHYAIISFYTGRHINNHIRMLNIYALHCSNAVKQINNETTRLTLLLPLNTNKKLLLIFHLNLLRCMSIKEDAYKVENLATRFEEQLPYKTLAEII